ncbi:hypothetical protein KPATCC21470_0400 [Kitasatospora purpeofusca]
MTAVTLGRVKGVGVAGRVAPGVRRGPSGGPVQLPGGVPVDPDPVAGTRRCRRAAIGWSQGSQSCSEKLQGHCILASWTFSVQLHQGRVR